MSKLEELRELYQKIKNGKATESEKVRYDLLFKTSCVDEHVLRNMVEANYSKESLE